MSEPAPHQSRRNAALLAVFAVGVASMQDAVVKGVSADLPASETIIFRTMSSLPLLMAWLVWSGRLSQMFMAGWPSLLLRSAIMCSAYFAFVLSIAALPIATSVSIYFTMPFFVAALAGWGLGEQVRYYRWIAISVGFAGVLVMVRPGFGEGLPAMVLAFYSAFGYAVSQMMGRHLSQRIAPAVMANWQNLTYFAAACVVTLAVSLIGPVATSDKSLEFLLRPWAWPNGEQLVLLLAMGVLSTIASVGFTYAYRSAEANFVAPFEYTALLWAVMNGLLFFGDFPDVVTWVGVSIVILAGLWMLWMDQRTAKATAS
jgi:drug/metabolite transporter (DMT)-like permease